MSGSQRDLSKKVDAESTSRRRGENGEDMVAMLQEAQVHGALGAFSLEDLVNLSQHLHFFDFDEDEVVMQRGEVVTQFRRTAQYQYHTAPARPLANYSVNAWSHATLHPIQKGV